MGTGLQAAGLPLGVPSPWWTLSHPEEVVALHRAYLDAGAQVLHANGFGATPAQLGLGPQACAELAARAVRLARRAGPSVVAGSLAPTGAWGAGGEGPAAGLSAHRDQGLAYLQAGADLLHLETQTSLDEALAALDLLRGLGAGVPVWVSLTPRTTGGRAYSGEPLGEALSRLADAGAQAVGLNCSLGAQQMAELARALPPGLPLLLRPQGTGADPAWARELPGLCGVGGCCGATPGDIAGLLPLHT
ncbi:MAG: homocysteine S-methyltransferase family protein [Deltaproteobacteria bacterium]|nr:homocysteine S-methyltransferase family protein [Deltaproteobacteria bacterium]